jgi:outer membrane receptor protein involved in Fe transport
VSFALSDPAVAAIRIPTNIAPQELGGALRVLAADRRLQILYTTQAVSNRQTSGAVGDFTVAEALDRLLDGTDLMFRYADENTIAIMPRVDRASAGEPGAAPHAAPARADTPSPLPSDISAPVPTDQIGQGPAQSDPTAELTEIVVTGSRIQRRDATAVGPLTTVTAEDMALAAPTSVGDLLQSLPSVGVSLNSNGSQGTSFGVSSINLRYLGSAEGSGNRTLVLVDGHRFVNAVGGRGFRDFVDLNSIPLGMIDRIEVLKDGASAIYGADAIAGVVNIHTRRSLDGFEADVRYGVSDEGDADNHSGIVNWGASAGSFSTLLSVSYSDTKPILTTSRSLTTRALTPLTLAPPSDRGLFTLPRLANNAYFGTPVGFGTSSITPIPGAATGSAVTADEAFRVATLPADDYNQMVQGLYASGPSERLGVFGRVSYELTDNVSARVEALYSERTSEQMLSPPTLDIRGSSGFSIAADQQFNPFGTANGIPTANALAFGADASVPAASRNAFRIQRLLFDVGNRNQRQEIDTRRFAAALEGRSEALGRDWTWELFGSWSRNHADFNSFNQINLENVYLSQLAPSACAAIAGCIQVNLFGPMTADQADYVRFDATDLQTTKQTNAAFNVSGELFTLPAGALGIAAGYEYRRESASDLPDPFAASSSSVLPVMGGAAQLPTTHVTRSPTSGSYDLHEVYAETAVPLIKGWRGIHSFDIDAAVRYSRYSTVGGKATTKFGVAYRPVEDVLVRGTYSQGFRAPSILELYQGERQINFQGVDPCNGGGAGRSGCAGVPTTYNQAQFNNGLIAGITAGNRNLEPETADTYSAGLAFTPAAIGGLTLTADWFEIEVDDAIATNSATNILNSCANLGVFCDLIVRGSLGEVVQLTQAVVNLSRIEVAGVDAGARYRFGTSIGDFEAALDAAYLDKFRTFIPQPDGSIAVDDRAGKSDQPRSTFPHWKSQASIRYSTEAYGLSWKTRYIGSSRDIPGNAVNGGRLKEIFYHDLQGTLELAGRGLGFAIGVDNVFDQMPPASAANNPINFDIYTYDIRGRYFYLKAGAKF